MHKEEDELLCLLPRRLAPKYLQDNPYIHNGYRPELSTKSCVKSMFRWTNQTINIWSHFLGFILFMVLLHYDLKFWNLKMQFLDKLLLVFTLVCFQITMILSASFHLICCRSERHHNDFLMYDRMGVGIALLGIYATGFRYIFWCHEYYYWFYILTACALFVVMMISQLPSSKLNDVGRMASLVLWTLYGLIPVLHWSFGLMGGFDDPMVVLWFPRLMAMWLLTGTAFVIYVFQIPERLCPGKVDFVGSSHQWWHALLLWSLYHWHNTVINYVNFWSSNTCANQEFGNFS